MRCSTIGEENLNSLIAPKLKSELVIFAEKGIKNLVFDLSNVHYVDSSGLSSILTANRLWKGQGSFVLTGIQHPNVKKLIEISRLDTVLEHPALGGRCHEGHSPGRAAARNPGHPGRIAYQRTASVAAHPLQPTAQQDLLSLQLALWTLSWFASVVQPRAQSRVGGLRRSGFKVGTTGFLIDCAEGTQIALQAAGIGWSDIDYILISHLHGDHYYGLPGLLTSWGLNQRQPPTDPDSVRRGWSVGSSIPANLSYASLPFRDRIG
jgi:anti-anti-sigma factor